MIPESISTEEIRLQGIPVSPGIALGIIKTRVSGSREPGAYDITEDEVEAELVRFHQALQQTAGQIKDLRDRMIQISGEKDAAIFDAHILLLQDKAILNQVSAELSRRLQNVEHIFYVVMQNNMEVLRRVNDPYLRAKTTDMEDVMHRVIQNLRSTDLDEDEEEEDTEPLILVAYDLTPSDTAAMDSTHIHGFATEMGSSVSHTAILARSMGIPAVVGLDQALLKVESHASAILDGYKGSLILKPSQETIDYYKRLQVEKEKAYKALEDLRDLPSVTRDGHKIKLSVNVEFPHEYSSISEVGAEGVGLFRTEFFLLGNPEGIPDEEEQTVYYKKMVQNCAPYGVIFRTLDAGGDKLPSERLSSPEPNPFLGWRGIRVSLSRPDMFREQLRAILRACADTPGCGVMFPMVSGYTEVVTAKALLEECKQELEQKNIPYSHDLKVGIMIEVPSAAIMADVLAKEVDFFSVGTNDLTQYAIAVDRVNNRVANMFRPTHPGVIRMIDMTITAGDREGIPTSICGEMAGDITLLPLLVGLGATVMSVGVHLVPIIRYAIRHLDQSECRLMAREALQASNSRTIVNLSTNLAKVSYPALFE